MPESKEIKQNLVATLFKSGDEKLLFGANVTERSQSGSRNKLDTSDDGKVRIISITSTIYSFNYINKIAKKNKMKISKIKSGNNSSFSIVKSWGIDEIKSLAFGDVIRPKLKAIS